MAYENEGLPDYNEATGEFGDRVHDRSLNDGEGGDRYAFPHESVRAIVQQRKAEIAARNDPVERYRQIANKHWRKLEDLVGQVEACDNAGPDVLSRIRWVARQYGVVPHTAAQHLYAGTDR